MQIDPGTFRSAEERGACSEKEKQVLEKLTALGIPYAGVTHTHADTIADCHAVEAALGAPICKNLFLCNAQKTAYYLLILPGDKVFKTKYLSKQINSARLSFGDAGAMERLLGCTPGSASALGLLFDTEKQVRFLIDNDLMQEEFWGFHPCLNTATLRISRTGFTDIFLPALGVSPTFVDLPDGCDEPKS